MRDFELTQLLTSFIWTDLSIPPDGAEPGGGAAVPGLLEVTLPVAPVDARRNHGVPEPEEECNLEDSCIVDFTRPRVHFMQPKVHFTQLRVYLTQPRVLFTQPEGGLIVLAQMLLPVRLIFGRFPHFKMHNAFCKLLSFYSACSFCMVRLILSLGQMRKGCKMSEGMSGGKMSGAKMSKGMMTNRFRFNRPGELSDGINMPMEINLTKRH